MHQRARYLFEVGMLNRTPRSGFQFLGSGGQSVAEHTHRMLHIAIVLAQMSAEHVDERQLLRLVLFHDLPEARTGDQNYVNRRYVHEDLERLLDDGARVWPEGETIAANVREFEAAETREARIAKDADQIELVLMLKEQKDLGNSSADDWIDAAVQRLNTDMGKKLAAEILETKWDEWWYHDKNDRHWVEGKKHRDAGARAQGSKRAQQKPMREGAKTRGSKR